MVIVVSCEIVESGEILPGAHIEVVGGFGVENGIDSSLRCRADRPRRQSVDFVRIVRSRRIEMAAGDTPYCEITEGESDGRVGLQTHFSVQPVDVEPSDLPFFGDLVGLFIYNGGDRHYFGRGEAESCGFFSATVAVPDSEIVVT